MLIAATTDRTTVVATVSAAVAELAGAVATIVAGVAPSGRPKAPGERRIGAPVSTGSRRCPAGWRNSPPSDLNRRVRSEVPGPLSRPDVRVTSEVPCPLSRPDVRVTSEVPCPLARFVDRRSMRRF
jgi:hypothetical protein